MYSCLYREVTFQQAGPYVNLSRVNPLDISMSLPPRQYIVPCGDQSSSFPFMCLLVGEVVGCCLNNPKAPVRNQTNENKQIEVKLFVGEFERVVCALGHILRVDSIALPIQDGTLHFTTSNYHPKNGT